MRALSVANFGNVKQGFQMLKFTIPRNVLVGINEFSANKDALNFGLPEQQTAVDA